MSGEQVSKAADAFRTISEVAAEFAIPKHVLRFWEGRFPQIRPMKRGGGLRYYRPEDLDLLRGIRHLLHSEGYTIKGVQKILRECGVDDVKRWGRGGAGSVAPKRSEAVAKGRGQPRAARGGKPAMIEAKVGPRTIVAGAIKELEACRDLLNTAAISVPERSGKPGRTG